MREREEKLDTLSEQMDHTGAKQCREAEPEAKRMCSDREDIVVGYSVQTAVEAEAGLIVHYDVTGEGSDNRQLEPMTTATQSALDIDHLKVLADAGYSNGEQLASCEEKGITATVATNRAVNLQGDHYQKSDFHCDPEQDYFVCPAG